MFTQSMLTAEIALNRQAQVLRQAERWHRLFRPATAGTIVSRPSHCAVIDLPVAGAHTSPVEALVA
jgi:hypothetical protein